MEWSMEEELMKPTLGVYDEMHSNAASGEAGTKLIRNATITRNDANYFILPHRSTLRCSVQREF